MEELQSFIQLWQQRIKQRQNIPYYDDSWAIGAADVISDLQVKFKETLNGTWQKRDDNKMFKSNPFHLGK